MWFRRSKGESQPSEDLRDAFRELRKDFRALQGEWDVTYDKIRILMGRISKRAAIMQETNGQEEESAPEVPLAEGASPAPNWTVNMHKAQAQILARRARGIPSS